MTTWLVSRHTGALAWLSSKGFHPDRIVPHLDIAAAAPGDIVIGTLPVHLAADLCASGARYFHLCLAVPPQWRGRELSAEEMEAAGAEVKEFTIIPMPAH